MFKPHDKVVYPGHGVAQIIRIITKRVAGKITSFFELRFVHKEMTILVPVDNAIEVGIRSLCSHEYVHNLFKVLSEPYKPALPEAIIANWNKRNKEYLGKIRSGDLREIGVIYRDLKHIEKHKKGELSFGEKSLLHQTESMLVQEIALVENLPEEDATQYVRSLIGQQQA